MNRRLLAVIVFVCFIPAAVGCGPLHMVDLTDPRYTVEKDEKALLDEADRFSEKLRTSRFLIREPRWEEPLNRILSCVAPMSWPSGRVQPRVFIIDQAALNAFALPNGHIFINVGVLALAESEDQIAVILAHELAHVIRRHGLLTKRTAAHSGAVYGVLALPAAAFGGIAGSLGLDLAVVSSMLGYSRQMEREADRLSVETVANKGYDPSQGVRLFKNMKTALEKEDIKEPFFFSTHPALNERARMYQTLSEIHASAVRDDSATSCRVFDPDEFVRLHDEWVLRAADRAMERGMYRLAEHMLEHVWIPVRASSLNGPRHYRLGLLWQERQDGSKRNTPRNKNEDWEEAARHFRKAFALDPDRIEALKRLAVVEYKKGDVEAARRSMSHYLTLNPNDPQRSYWEEVLNCADGCVSERSDKKEVQPDGQLKQDAI